MFNVDSVFRIGNSHKICQDWSHHKDNVVVLSDGCSGCQYVDVGARILALSALQFPRLDNFNVIDKAASIIDDLQFDRDCLHATLLRIELTDESFIVDMAGDGCIVSREREGGKLNVTNIAFPSNAPYYLRYNLDGYREKYIDNVGCYVRENEDEYQLFERWPEGIIRKSFSRAEHDLVAIFSDGISSFSQSGKSMSIKEVVEDLMNFKNYNGDFVQRRCQRAFQKFEEDGVSHYDDFSMGVIYDEQ